jgi:hypothetical protein
MSTRLAFGLLAGVAILTATACGSEPTSPGSAIAAPSATTFDRTNDHDATTVDVKGQSWKNPVMAAKTVSARVSRTEGAVLSIPELGVTVTIPANAVRREMTITMTALAGSVVAFDFQPAGTKFKKPLTASQDLSRTQWDGQPFDVVYFKHDSDVGKKHVKASEFIPVSVSGKTALFDIKHFSGYAVAAGRGSSGF